MRLLSCQEKTISQAYDIEALKAKIRQCDVCAHAVKPLPVVPNPILQGNAQSKIRIIGFIMKTYLPSRQWGFVFLVKISMAVTCRRVKNALRSGRMN